MTGDEAWERRIQKIKNWQHQTKKMINRARLGAWVRSIGREERSGLYQKKLREMLLHQGAAPCIEASPHSPKIPTQLQVEEKHTIVAPCIETSLHSPKILTRMQVEEENTTVTQCIEASLHSPNIPTRLQVEEEHTTIAPCIEGAAPCI